MSNAPSPSSPAPVPASKRPVCLVLALVAPILAVPLSLGLGVLLGDSSKEFGQFVFMAGGYLLGVLLCWSLAFYGCLRGERPRLLAVAAVALSIAPFYWVH